MQQENITKATVVVKSMDLAGPPAHNSAEAIHPPLGHARNPADVPGPPCATSLIHLRYNERVSERQWRVAEVLSPWGAVEEVIEGPAMWVADGE